MSPPSISPAARASRWPTWLRAVTPGDFYLPGAEVLDMYHAGVNARTAGGRTDIAPGA